MVSMKVNSMEANLKKFQFMILGESKRQAIILNINNIKITKSQNIELLGRKFDNRLTFTCYAVELIISFMQ